MLSHKNTVRPAELRLVGCWSSQIIWCSAHIIPLNFLFVFEKFQPRGQLFCVVVRNKTNTNTPSRLNSYFLIHIFLHSKKRKQIGINKQPTKQTNKKTPIIGYSCQKRFRYKQNTKFLINHPTTNNHTHTNTSHTHITHITHTHTHYTHLTQPKTPPLYAIESVSLSFGTCTNDFCI